VFTFKAERTRRDERSWVEFIEGERNSMNYETVGTMWKRFKDALGIKNLRLHDLRHTYGSGPLRKLKNLRVVQEARAAADIKTTTRYAHVLQDQVAGGGSRRSRPFSAELRVSSQGALDNRRENGLQSGLRVGPFNEKHCRNKGLRGWFRRPPKAKVQGRILSGAPIFSITGAAAHALRPARLAGET
jgi:hypothetical protein